MGRAYNPYGLYEGTKLIAKCRYIRDAATLLFMGEIQRTLKWNGKTVWNVKKQGKPERLIELQNKVDVLREKLRRGSNATHT